MVSVVVTGLLDALDNLNNGFDDNSWFWSKWFWLWSNEFDLSDGSSEVNDLLVILFNDSLVDSDLLLDDWLLLFWGSWEFNNQLVDLSFDDGDLFGEFDDLLLEDSDEFSFNWGQWFWDQWGSWVSNNSDNSLDVFDSLDDLGNLLLEDDNLSFDDWSLVNRSSLVDVVKVDDLLLVDVDLLDVLSNSLLDDLDDLLLDDSLFRLWSLRNDEFDSSDGVLDVNNLFVVLSNNLDQSNNLLLDDWLLWFRSNDVLSSKNM